MLPDFPSCPPQSVYRAHSHLYLLRILASDTQAPNTFKICRMTKSSVYWWCAYCQTKLIIPSPKAYRRSWSIQNSISEWTSLILILKKKPLINLFCFIFFCCWFINSMNIENHKENAFLAKEKRHSYKLLLWVRKTKSLPYQNRDSVAMRVWAI